LLNDQRKKLKKLKADKEFLNRLQLINYISPSLQNAKENILYYILGYIILKIIKKLDYDSCISCLFKETSDYNDCSSTYCKFVNLRQCLALNTEIFLKTIMEAENMLFN